MASITLDLPAPVGPVRAKRSAPSKSISTGSRKAVKPATSRRSGRIGGLRLVEQLGEQGQQALVVLTPLRQVLGEQVLRGPARSRRARDAAGVVVGRRRHRHLDAVGEQL